MESSTDGRMVREQNGRVDAERDGTPERAGAVPADRTGAVSAERTGGLPADRTGVVPAERTGELPRGWSRARWSGRALSRLDGWTNGAWGAAWNPVYQSGALTVALLAVVLVTGLYLLLYYRLGSPYESVARVTDQAWSGRWIRSLHRYASDAAVVTAAVHAFRLYAQRRTWGPRALAWLSGVALVGLILVCGWTGYVMVWDNHGHLLAVEGARLLDVLPIFSEPIGRAFVGERPLPSAFFFLNLFAHVALPVGLALVLWIHVSRVARPTLVPPRGLTWGVVSGLMVLSLVWPVAMAAPAELLRSPGVVPLDVFYGFWLPAAMRMPAWSVWLVGGVLTTVLLGVPWLTRPRASWQPPRSVVDERVCTGCEQCMLDCPYEAIRMVERTDDRPGVVARVDESLCVSCGICAGSCAPMGVGPAGRTGRDQLRAARALIERRRPSGGDVVVIGCAHGAAIPVNEDIVPFVVECAGSLHTSVIEAFVRAGAAGVVVSACPARDCRGREGVTWLNARVHDGREAELKERVDRRRVRIVHHAAAEGASLRRDLAAFRASLPRPDGPGDDDGFDLIELCDRPVGAAGEP